MRQYKAALIGCGRIGSDTRPELAARLPKGWLPLSHADAMSALPTLALMAFSDTNKEALVLAQQRFKVSRGYQNPYELLEKEKPEVLSIATRTDGRCELIQAAVASGVKAIHAEKPLSRTLAQTRHLLSLLKQEGVYFTYGTTRRYMPIYQEAKAMVESGKIGQLQQIQIAFGQGALFWLHPHSVDLILYFSNNGAVKTVQADCSFAQGVIQGKLIDCDPEVNFARILFEGGLEALITKEPGMNLRLIGDSGTLEVVADGTKIRLFTSAEGSPLRLHEEQMVSQAQCSGTKNAFSALVMALETGTELPISLDEVEKNQALLFAMVASALEGSRPLDFDKVSVEYEISGRTGQLFA